MEEHVSELQAALSEAALILECSDYLLESENRDPVRWREMVSILNRLAADRLRQASAIISNIETGGDLTEARY